MSKPTNTISIFADQIASAGNRPALWSKRDGRWQSTTWRDYAALVRQFGQALIKHGVAPKACVGIIGFNREEWLAAYVGAVSVRAIPVGLYTTSSAEQVAYILSHCDAPVVVVENESYLSRVLSVRNQLPNLRHIVVMDSPATLPPGVVAWSDWVRQGAAETSEAFDARVAAIESEDVATLIYTSGTTGHPKAVMLTHANAVWTAQRLVAALGVRRGEEVLLSYLPLSHIAEQICSIFGPIYMGIEVFFAESMEKLPDNIKEVRPTVFFGVPRVWEKFAAKARARIAQSPPARQKLVAWAQAVALRWHTAKMSGDRPTLSDHAQYALAQALVFSKLKARIGFDRTHLFATSAAPIGRDVLDFFASCDIVLREIYGQSEVTGPTTVNTPDATRLGTLGRPLYGVEVRIADDGEILVRGGNVCAGYYKDPVATAQLLEGGWLHSGDVGVLDKSGYLTITGRKKELIVTSGGKKTAPAYIEGLIRAIEPVGHALVVGDNRNYLVALITLDPDRVAAFAQARGWGSDAAALAADRSFRSYLQAQLDAQVNAKLARFESIKKFDILARDFSIDGGELTSTLKVRRSVCEAKYRAEIDALYAD